MVLVGLATVLASGCDGAGAGSGRVTEIQALRDKIETQQRKLVAKDEQVQAQASLIQELQGLTGPRSLDRLVHVSRIELERLTGGYDDDHDGVDEGVVVYLRLIDQDGDTIKAAGGVQIRLIDLAKPEGSQLVGHVELSPAALHPMWFGRLMTSHYTIRVPWSGDAERAEHESITVHVRFTDLLSGQSFEAQEVVEVSGATPVS